MQSCNNKLEFESDGWTSKGALAQGQFEILNYVGSDGTARLVRVPSGMTRGMSGNSVKDGSLEAKDGIKWQDRRVPAKIQLGLVLDQLETLLRCFQTLFPVTYFIVSLHEVGMDSWIAGKEVLWYTDSSRYHQEEILASYSIIV